MARVLTDETSLSRRRRRLVSEGNILTRLRRIEAVVAIALVVGGIILFAVNGSTTVLWVGGIIGVLAVGHWLQAKQHLDEGRALDAGIAGEAEVTKRLAEYLDNRFFIFNDIILSHGRKTAQVDHLVLGPNGVFVIETKNWRGRVVGDVSDRMWRQLRNDRNRAVPMHSPYLQNQRHKDVIASLFAAHHLEVPDLISLLINRNRRATFDITGLPIPILEPSEACEWIATHRGTKTYTEAEVDALVSLVMKKVAAS